ncbi:MAG: ThuA domain-containing protein [Victivallaceae bacterium]
MRIIIIFLFLLRMPFAFGDNIGKNISGDLSIDKGIFTFNFPAGKDDPHAKNRILVKIGEFTICKLNPYAHAPKHKYAAWNKQKRGFKNTEGNIVVYESVYSDSDGRETCVSTEFDCNTDNEIKIKITAVSNGKIRLNEIAYGGIELNSSYCAGRKLVFDRKQEVCLPRNFEKKFLTEKNYKTVQAPLNEGVLLDISNSGNAAYKCIVLDYRQQGKKYFRLNCLKYGVTLNSQNPFCMELKLKLKGAVNNAQTGSDINVGIYKAIGSSGINAGLKKVKGINAKVITDFAKMANYDVLVFPSIKPSTTPEWRELLRSYVKSGYGVILLHDTCGYRGWPTPLFPELVKGVGRQESALMVKAGVSHPVVNGIPEKFEHAYFDHIILEPGRKGTVIMKDKEGCPIVVAGEFGKGRVVAFGNLCGLSYDKQHGNVEKSPENGELKLLLNSIKWAASASGKNEKLKLFTSYGMKRQREFDGWAKREERKANLLLDDLKYDFLTEYNFFIRKDLEKPGTGKLNAIRREAETLKKETENKISIFEQEIKKIFSSVSEEKSARMRAELKKLYHQLDVSGSQITGQIISLKEKIKNATGAKKETYDIWNKDQFKNNFTFFQMLGPGFPPHAGKTAGCRPALPQLFSILKQELHTQIIVQAYVMPFERPEKERVLAAKQLNEHLDWAYQNGLQLVFVLRRPWNAHKCSIPKGKKWNPQRYICYSHPENRKILKEMVGKMVDAMRGHPAFRGIFLDEWTNGGGKCPCCIKAFKDYLKKKYPNAEFEKLGIKDIDRDVTAGNMAREKNQALWMEHQEFNARQMLDTFRELSDHVHSLDEKFIFWPVSMVDTIGFAHAEFSRIGDISSLDPYYDTKAVEPFFCDLQKKTTALLFELFVGYQYWGGDWVKKAGLDLSIGTVHADGISYFIWPLFWKYPPRTCVDPHTKWTPGMWEAVKDAVDRANKVKDYLVGAKDICDTAILYSERSRLVLGRSYLAQQVGAYSIFTQEHIPAAPVYAENLTPDMLQDYSVLVMLDAVALTEKQMDIIRNWVKKGGILLASARSTGFDQWGGKLKDYRLNDLFGASFLKRVRSDKIIRMKISSSHPSLGKLSEADEISYNNVFGYDLVKPTGRGKLVARWEDGNPALIINDYGKGKVVFCTASGLGFCCDKYKNNENGYYSDFINSRYLSGIGDFFANVVIAGLKNRKKSLPFRMINCPGHVETVMKRKGGNYILHLLNYDPAGKTVKGVSAEICVPAAGKPKIFYPADKTAVPYLLKEGRICLKVRNFDVHEMIVIQYE